MARYACFLKLIICCVLRTFQIHQWKYVKKHINVTPRPQGVGAQWPISFRVSYSLFNPCNVNCCERLLAWIIMFFFLVLGLHWLATTLWRQSKMPQLVIYLALFFAQVMLFKVFCSCIISRYMPTPLLAKISISINASFYGNITDDGKQADTALE